MKYEELFEGNSIRILRNPANKKHVVKTINQDGYVVDQLTLSEYEFTELKAACKTLLPD
jgi:hypothetical protein